MKVGREDASREVILEVVLHAEAASEFEKNSKSESDRFEVASQSSRKWRRLTDVIATGVMESPSQNQRTIIITREDWEGITLGHHSLEGSPRIWSLGPFLGTRPLMREERAKARTTWIEVAQRLDQILYV